MATQHLVPGVGYVEDAGDDAGTAYQHLIPGFGYVTITDAVVGGGFQAAWARNANSIVQPGAVR